MNSHLRNKRLAKALKEWSFLLIAITFLFLYYNTTTTTKIEHLKAVADLSAEQISASFVERNFDEITFRFSQIEKAHSLDSIILLGDSGDMLAGQNLNTKVSDSLEFGGMVDFALPATLYYQYTKILLQDERPAGYLVIQESSSILFFVLTTTVILIALMWSFTSSAIFQMTLGRTAKDRGLTGSARSQSYVDGSENKSALLQKISELEQERDAAFVTIKAKGDFLAHVSHEIRTSLHGIMGVLSLLKTSGLAGEKKRLVEAAENSSNALLFIIDDILDFSKITSGKIEFESIEFNLREAVEDCLALYIDAARAKKVDLHSYVPLEINPHIKGDPTRLRQILTNLLSNAVKFTNKGDVSIRLSLIEEMGEKQRLRFTVEDTGIGIAQEKLEGIFDMFAQADEKTARKYGGTGLGLTVCKNLIELQNGEIGVKSRPGHGTLFWFTLDYIQVEKSPEYTLAPEVSGKEVVIFESCETCSTILHQYLSACNVRNILVEDIEDVLEKLERIKTESKDWLPDFVLVDYGSITKRIDRLTEALETLYPEKTPACYVLLHNSRLERQILAAGITGIIHKPIRINQLYDGLSGKSINEIVESTAYDIESLHGKVLLVDDEIINQHVGEMILRKLGLDVDLAGSGLEALEKIEKREYDLILMDIQMPDMSGIEVTEKIRDREKDSGQEPIVIIAVTANALGSMRQRSLDAGMNGFIVKPIQPDLLVDYLKPWLAVPHQVESGRRPEMAYEDSEMDEVEEQATWDRNLALQYLGGDEDLLQDLMKLFIHRKNKLLTAIEDAMKTTDGEAISCAAHAFKGAVNHFAAKKCQRLALTIEYKAGEGGLEGLDNYFSELQTAADTLEKELKEQVLM